MKNVDTISPTDTQDLSTLIERIHDEHRAVQAAGGALLHHAMNAGDVLTVVQKKVSGNWKSWLRENCSFLSVHTALVYQRLARRREWIEAEVERVGDLSLRAALRLTAKPKGGAKKNNKAKSRPTLLDHWKRASDVEQTTFLDHVGVDGIRKSASLDFLRKLQERARVEKVESNPDASVTNLIRKALSHIVSADAPQTSKPVAAGNINEALNSLRAVLKKLGTIQHTYHDISVGISAGKVRTTRRAA
jgi:hypothetical protein